MGRLLDILCAALLLRDGSEDMELEVMKRRQERRREEAETLQGADASPAPQQKTTSSNSDMGHNGNRNSDNHINGNASENVSNNRMEELRQFCEGKLGEERFLSLYKYLRRTHEQNYDDSHIQETLDRILGAELLPYALDVQKLIIAEDMVFG